MHRKDNIRTLRKKHYLKKIDAVKFVDVNIFFDFAIQ